MVNKARLIEKMADHVKEKRIEGITEIRDESNREGIRIVIELRKDVQPEVILNQLFKLTALHQGIHRRPLQGCHRYRIYRQSDIRQDEQHLFSRAGKRETV